MVDVTFDVQNTLPFSYFLFFHWISPRPLVPSRVRAMIKIRVLVRVRIRVRVGLALEMGL